ncbi:penicillin-binding protein 2 [Ignavigranum ruoffiae]|uniref:peptidoglycan D,D-transpeptidase FtsI family protein n=1 Tax=Ignavigranum ruoffiae TaxID=89093 RepID=UPI00204C3B90|nr:penicillin-binding protein 2 [Ignavigranum ruoffiae]UPQ85630.1 penicillin-binding protein 2 [Ignavigranum ruoffiae]
MTLAQFQTKKNKYQSHIPRRLNLLFLIAFVVFAALFIRLGYLQLYNGEMFKNMVQRTQSTQSTGSVPRGMIYDSRGQVLVGNKPELAILYTRDRDSKISAQDIIKTATELASLIDIPTNTITERDMKDYFLVKNPKVINGRLSKEEKLLNGSEAYKAQLSKVTAEDIQFSDAEKKIVALFTKMNSAFALSTVTVKNQNVTQEEVARVSEQLANLHGVSIGTDWQRVYPNGEMMKSIFGQVSSEQRGLPSELAKNLIAKGYAMNDRVGISYLEQQYEDVLRGTKSLYNIVTNSADDILSNQMIYEGKKGDNLVLTTNINFQKKLDDIAENALKQMTNRGLNDRVYIVAINPKNGDILGMSGKRFAYDEATDAYNYDKIVDDTLGVMSSSYGMGSSIKPAMVATGYKEGVISLDNNVIIDEPLKFQASQEKSSVFNRTGKIPIDDIRALQESSNIYMIKLAMRIGGQNSHEENGPLLIKPNTIQIIRNDLAEFGLGTATGIDLPIESQGFSPESDQLVSALDLSYGQFDLYTPLQMAQYVSTIANGGIRYSPRLVKEIRGTDANGELGEVKTSIPPKILNVINLDPQVIGRIQEGMRQVSHTDAGTARYFFLNYPITIGSKTGTTEAFYAGPIKYQANKPVTNATYVGYAPFDDPEIAISVVVPYLEEASWGRESTRIAYEVMNAYFEMQDTTSKKIQEYIKANPDADAWVQ